MPGPAPKSRDTRQNRIKRPEIGLVKVDPADKPVVPKCPPGLLASTRKRWRSYWLSPVAKAVDIASDLSRVERWIQAIDEYERVFKVFKGARLVKGSTGQPVLNPLAAYLAQLEANISRAENELGLTPMARQKLGIAIGQARLTAEALNKSLDEAPEVREIEAWEGEWQEA